MCMETSVCEGRCIRIYIYDNKSKSKKINYKTNNIRYD